MVARALGPEGRGAYHLPVTIVSIAYYVLNLGLDQAQFRLWSTDDRSRRLLPATGLALGIGLGVGGAVSLILIRVLWSSGFLAQVPLTHIAITAAALPFMVHGLLLTGLSILRGAIPRMNVAVLAAAVLHTLSVTILFLVGGLNVTVTIVIWACITGIPWLVMLRTASQSGALFPPSTDLIRRQLLLGLRYAPYVFFGFLILRVDVLLIAQMMGLSSVGVYSVAVLFPEVVWVITDSLAYPIANRQANLPHDQAAGLTVVAVRVVLLLVLPATALVAINAQWLIPLAYGAAFEAAGRVVWALTPGVIGLAVWRTLNPYLVRTQSPWTQPTIAGAALVANILLNLLLIPLWGIMGAAGASSIAYLLGAAIALRIFLRTNEMSVTTLVPSRTELMLLWNFGRSTWEGMRKAQSDRAGRRIQ